MSHKHSRQEQIALMWDAVGDIRCVLETCGPTRHLSDACIVKLASAAITVENGLRAYAHQRGETPDDDIDIPRPFRDLKL